MEKNFETEMMGKTCSETNNLRKPPSSTWTKYLLNCLFFAILISMVSSASAAATTTPSGYAKIGVFGWGDTYAVEANNNVLVIGTGSVVELKDITRASAITSYTSIQEPMSHIDVGS
jgi:hypothetical protein